MASISQQNKVKIDQVNKPHSIPSLKQASFRTRAGLPKTRSGCTTCKIRRVKCDEQKPGCNRCISTGRHCDGYIKVIPVALQNSQLSSTRQSGLGSADSIPYCMRYYSPIFDNSGRSQELRSFKYFQSRVDGISGYFESDFWERLVLQVSHSEPTVRLALLALSSIYEAHEYGQQGPSNSRQDVNEALNNNALQQYTKAVAALFTGLSEDKTPLQITLITCLLFIWIEFLRNDSDTAFKHLNSGLRILQRAKSLSLMENVTDNSIPALFERLKTQIAFHGCPNSDFNSNTLKKFQDPVQPIPSSFSNIFIARSHLDKEISSISIFIRRQQELDNFWASGNHSLQPPFPLDEIRNMHLQRLEQWFCAFQRLTIDFTINQDQKLKANFILTQLNHAYITILLETLFPSTELIYDSYTLRFAHLLSLVEALVTITNLRCEVSNNRVNSTLSFEDGIIMPLCFVIMKCRDLPLRQQAIRWLRQAPEREGMWHRDSVLHATQLKVFVEERGRIAEGLEGLPESARTTRERVIDLGGGKVRFGFRRSGNNDVEFTEDIEGVLSKIEDIL